MISIDLNDIIVLAVKNKSFLNLKFLLDYFTFNPKKSYEDDFVLIKENKFYGKLEEELVLLSSDYQQAILNLNDEITVSKDLLGNVEVSTTTLVGRVITNWLINTYCLNDKVAFINEEFTLGDIEDIIIELFDNTDDDAITVEEYKAFLDMRLYIDTFAMYFGVGVTTHSIKPAPGIAEYVTKTIKELEVKYNEKPLVTPSIIAELEATVIAYDVEYLKNDISYGKLVSKKVIKMARKRMYSVYGIGNDVTGAKTPILIALNNGIGQNPDVLTAIFNDLRGGVAARGNETKDAGVTTKELQKAVAGMTIVETDCGQTIGLEVAITKKTARLYIGKTIIGKVNTIITNDTYKNYIDKTIIVRDESRCSLEGGICLTCIGQRFKDYKKTIALMATDLGGMLLQKKLSKFHGVTLTLTKVSLSDIK